MLIALAPAVTVNAAQKTGDDGTTNWDFIVPVAHQKTIPSGYIGIYTAQDLDNVRNNLNAKYILMNNIDLSSWGNWNPIGDDSLPFNGVFDGNGYVIEKMKININQSAELYAGLFGYISGAKIQNIGMINSTITAESSNRNSYAGGIVGHSYSNSLVSITNCYNTGAVTAHSSYASSYAGGIIGYSLKSPIAITNCYNAGAVTADFPNGSSYTSCSSYAGGIASYSSSNSSQTISNCYNIGAITADNSTASYADSYAGGIVGSAPFVSSTGIVNCYNSGKVKASASSYYLATSHTGGIAGYSFMGIMNCYNTGNLTATSSSYKSPSSVYIGGVVAYSSASVTNCYNTGNMTSSASKHYVGGVSGRSYNSSAIIKNCYFINNISAAIGEKTDNVFVGNVKSLSKEAMRNRNSFEGFNFDTIWGFKSGVNDGRPVLRVFNEVDNTPATIANVTKIDTPLKTIYVQSGKSFTIPFAIYGGKNEIKASLTWKSSNAQVATVSQKGVVTVPKNVKKGKATITATAANGKKFTVVTVNVSDKAVALKKMTITAKDMKLGATQKLGIKLAQPKATLTKITFKSSNANGLYVDKAGNLVAKKKGTYTITVNVNSVTVEKIVKVT